MDHDLSPTTKQPEQLFHVTGMDCADCAQTVATGVSKLAGVESCQLSYATERLRVRGEVDSAAVIARVRELGYDVAPYESRQGASFDEAKAQKGGLLRYMAAQRDTRLALLGALLILPGLIFNELLPMLGLHSVIFDVMSVLAMVSAGLPVARSAWKALRINHDININVLMTIASVGAVLIGAYTEAGLVMVLFAIGEALEGYTASHARSAIRRLVEVVPAKATVLRPCIDCRAHWGQDGYEGGPCPVCGMEEVEVDVDALRVGETIIVRPGERIAMDGVISQGASTINEAPITGESLPVGKADGDAVYASTINGEGVLHVQVTHRPEDNTISRLIRLVEEAQESRAPAQKFVDRFARIYTPAVVALALIVAVAPPLLFGQPFLSTGQTQGWLYRALALLVVACPCALVISTPVSLVSALANAARHGVLVKGGVFLEALSTIRAVAFDKTGTLTRGEPAVVQVRAAGCRDESAQSCDSCDEMVALAGAVERQSEHPLAQAIVAEAELRGVQRRYGQAQDVRAMAGLGVSGRVEGRDVVVGSHRYFDQNFSHAPHGCETLDNAALAGQTALLVGADNDYVGYITVADKVRPSSAATVARLRQMGIEHLVMLTGDEPGAAHSVARQVGVTDVQAGLLPEDKVHVVSQLRDQVGAVAMVGDGINDAPALATATVGIAMGAAGTAQAMETADIALMADDLSKLPFAIDLSRTAMGTIRGNIAFSLIIKAFFLIIVLMGMGTLWMAVLADVGASLVVTLNAARLLKHPRPQLENFDANDGSRQVIDDGK